MRKTKSNATKIMFAEDMIIAYRYGEFLQKWGNIFVNLKSYGLQPLIFY